MEKLSFHRFPQNLMKTIEILLNNAHTSISSSKLRSQIKRGVIQGGITSPTFFNIFINNLIQELSKKFQIFVFADDLCGLVHTKKELKEIITIVENWCARMSMKLNKNKCGIIKLSENRLKLNKAQKNKKLMDIPYTNHYKYLGINFDQCLRPSAHIIYLEEKLKKYKRMISVLRFQNPPSHVFKILYTVFAQSVLEFGNFSFLINPNKSVLDKYACLYRKTIKLTFSLGKNTPNDSLFKLLCLPDPI